MKRPYRADEREGVRTPAACLSSPPCVCMQLGDTPLHKASKRNKTEVVVELLKSKATVNAKNKVMPRAMMFVVVVMVSVRVARKVTARMSRGRC